LHRKLFEKQLTGLLVLQVYSISNFLKQLRSPNSNAVMVPALQENSKQLLPCMIRNGEKWLEWSDLHSVPAGFSAWHTRKLKGYVST
jgi:hypothetical protein